jgi:Skp family chaperone for outer membrane proteins
MPTGTRGWLRQATTGLIAGGLIAGAGWMGGMASSGARSGPSAVAVVAIDRVIENLAEVKRMEDGIKTRLEQFKAQLEDIRKRKDQATSDLGMIPRDAPGRTDKEMELVLLDAEFKTTSQIYQQRVALEQADLTRQLYAKIARAVQELAVRDGWDLVLLDDRDLIDIPPQGALVDDVREAVRRKKVVYASRPVDITGAVIAKMNNEFVP